MSTPSSPLKQRALQKLLFRRFGMALGTYAMALLLLWLTVIGDFYHGSPVV